MASRRSSNPKRAERARRLVEPLPETRVHRDQLAQGRGIVLAMGAIGELGLVEAVGRHSSLSFVQ